MKLVIALRSEILKTKRTASFYLTIFAAALAPFTSIMELMTDGLDGDNRNTIFNELFTTRFQMTVLVSLPLFLILICTLLPQLEYKNNTWKQVLASPQTKWNVFVAKFINIQLLIIVFYIVNHLMMLLNAVILHLMEPSLNLFSQARNSSDIIMAKVNSYIALLAICSVQFWLGLKFKNFIIPMAIGIALWLTGSIIVIQKMDFAAYFPYSFHAYSSSNKYDPQFNGTALTSLVYTAVFVVIGFIDFKGKSVAG